MWVDKNLQYDAKTKLSRIKTTGRAPVAHAYIPTTQETEIRRIAVQSQPGQIVRDTLSWKSYHKKNIGLVEWLKVKALSSSPSNAKTKTKKQEFYFIKTKSTIHWMNL
jgi:hypothetical protein